MPNLVKKIRLILVDIISRIYLKLLLSLDPTLRLENDILIEDLDEQLKEYELEKQYSNIINDSFDINNSRIKVLDEYKLLNFYSKEDEYMALCVKVKNIDTLQDFWLPYHYITAESFKVAFKDLTW